MADGTDSGRTTKIYLLNIENFSPPIVPLSFAFPKRTGGFFHLIPLFPYSLIPLFPIYLSPLFPNIQLLLNLLHHFSQRFYLLLKVFDLI